MVKYANFRQNHCMNLEQRNWYEVTREFTAKRVSEQSSPRVMSVKEKVLADPAHWREKNSPTIRFFHENDDLIVSLNLFEQSTRKVA